MLINEIKSKVRQTKKKRVGRGSSSGHGKTSCRGHKGHKSRSGRTTYPGFAGGQMRLIRKLPKSGFNAYKRQVIQIVNLGNISKRIKKETLEITPGILKQAGLISSEKKPVKILSDGIIKRPLNFKGFLASVSAIKKIKEAGGKIQISLK